MAKPFIVPDSQEPGFSYVVRHPDYPSGVLPDISECERQTLYDLFLRWVHEDPSGNCMGTRAFDPDAKKLGDHYTWISKADAEIFVNIYGSGLDSIFGKYTDKSPGQQAPVAIYAANRAEWHLTEFAIYRGNRYFVSLYDTLGTDSVKYVLNHSEIEVLVCSIDKVERLLNLKEQAPLLKVIISMDRLDGPAKNVIASEVSQDIVSKLKDRANSLGIVLTDIDAVVAIGKENPTTAHPPMPEDTCSITYTSGTSGNPKGVVTAHQQFTNTANGVARADPVDRPETFSILPLAHCFERLVTYFTLYQYGAIGYYSGKVPNLLDDLQARKPTFMGVVPRILNRVYDKISTGINSATGIKGFLARLALSQKLRANEGTSSRTHFLWDMLVFNKVKAVLGGRLYAMVVGSAPMDIHVIKFLQTVLCARIVQGFGMTESNTCGMIELIDVPPSTSCGPPRPGMSVRLRDCPEMNYLSTDQPCPRGELLLKGKSIMSGYYKDDAMTSATIKDGWLYTGDIAQINLDGTISIIDRLKNIFKLSQGEYIAPDYLQVVYERHPLISQSYIHGDSDKSSLVAIVVPDPDAFVPWAREIAEDSSAELEALSSNPQVNEALLSKLSEHGRAQKLQGFEIIRAIHIEPEAFDIDKNQLLSNTLKLKRHFAATHYREVIDRLYTQLASKTN
ncbi:acetyl-CoA synthetase-like protein [Linderina pennispora]|uniref:Acetyl-CoA synthetase-like protein n=1 Tax=Linderina pennispora TaxID=61395 RepID=A0A1Y1W096_9FUNG|nr:acetyl-CoA synthetase-like protein [Linderina pennispora]ORX66938.1 acetyl-CoA synthetase-like protein [Linderina pennispora]